MFIFDALLVWAIATKIEVCSAKIETPIFAIPQIVKEVSVLERPSVSENDILLIAQLTLAEAEGESEYGKRLVIDTVLNRVDSETFPDTVESVIFQKNQYSPVNDGRLYKSYCGLDECTELVRDELNNRTNYEVLYFTANKYGKYGDPLFQEGHHCFSGEKENQKHE